MIKVEMICMANSRKEGGRCIAGIRTDGKGWIRPVSPFDDGTLYTSQYDLRERNEPRKLDLIEIPVLKQVCQPHQPENWLIDTDCRWKLISRPAPKEKIQIIKNHIFSGNLLFGDYSNKIASRCFNTTKSKESLVLIIPSDIVFTAEFNPYDNKNLKKRATFHLQDKRYNLPLTDPKFENVIEKKGIGNFTPKDLGIPENREIYFTISLGEEFEGYHYKLVASVIPMPTI